MFRPHPLPTVLRPRRGLGSGPKRHCRPSVGRLAAQEWGGFGRRCCHLCLSPWLAFGGDHPGRPGSDWKGWGPSAPLPLFSFLTHWDLLAGCPASSPRHVLKSSNTTAATSMGIKFIRLPSAGAWDRSPCPGATPSDHSGSGWPGTGTRAFRFSTSLDKTAVGGLPDTRYSALPTLALLAFPRAAHPLAKGCQALFPAAPQGSPLAAVAIVKAMLHIRCKHVPCALSPPLMP